MKKILFVGLVLSLFVFVGCDAKKEDTKKDDTNKNDVEKNDTNNENTSGESKTMSCVIKQNSTDPEFDLESNMKIFYTGDTVDKVETKEVVVSSSDEIIAYFKSTLDLAYGEAGKKYGGYTTDIDVDGDTLTSIVVIDYSKMDLVKFAADQPMLKNYLNSSNTKLTVSGLKKLYEGSGATCTE